MKKLTLTLIIAVFAVISAGAQSKTPLLDSFQNIKTFEADFVQENYYPGIESYQYKGRVYAERGNKALWDYTVPEEFYLLEAGSVLHYSAELNQALRIRVNMNDYSDAAALLLGILLNTASVADGFAVTESANAITLVPKTDIGMDSMIITFRNGTLTSFASTDSAGNKITITFSNVKQNAGIDAKVFTKVLPENTEYIEQ